MTCSYWGERYTRDYIINGKVFLHKTIFFFEEGKSSCFGMQHERDTFGKNLAREWTEKPNRANEVIADFRNKTKDILDLIAESENAEITNDIYNRFWAAQDAYYKPHINVKFVTDYLPKEFLGKFLSDLDSARLYAEPVFAKTEEFMNKYAAEVGKKINYPTKYILHLTKDELGDCLSGKSFPSQEVLEKRFKKSALLFIDGAMSVVTDNNVNTIEKAVFIESKKEEIKGTAAFKGKVSGIVRVIHDPSDAKNFKDGDILVTGMTRPEYLPLMQKAAAFVTDTGGVLSHAAIVARELKKPCIIGTKIATRVFKDGDLVEVDAETGIVRILKKG